MKNDSVKLLVMAGSLRKDSLNLQLARLAVKIIEKHGGGTDLVSMQDFDSPSFNQDIEIDNVKLPGVDAFNNKLLENDGFVICSPEYNASMPGLLKNLIDWTSRLRPQPFNGRHALLMSASPSMAGGNRGLWSLRIPLENLGARVYPDMFSLAIAHKAFTSDGEIADENLSQRFEENLISFMSLVEATKHYPCIKKDWVEFLGEPTHVSLGRVQ